MPRHGMGKPKANSPTTVPNAAHGTKRGDPSGKRGQANIPASSDGDSKATSDVNASSSPALDKEWRATWFKNHQTTRCRPSEAVFAAAAKAYEDASLSLAERRMAATLTLPTITPESECFEMLIIGKTLSNTFPIGAILDSLGQSAQPSTWTQALPSCRDFAKVKNVGISFTCTDRESVTKLGNLSVNICGRPHKIREYSEWSQNYWVELTIPKNCGYTHDVIYNWFADQGCPPLTMQGTYQKRSVCSRSLTVYFPTPEIPECLLLGPNDPVREIRPTSNPTYIYVQHRISRFNEKVPDSIAAKRLFHANLNRTQRHSSPKPATDMDPNDSEDEAKESDNMSEVSIAQSKEASEADDSEEEPEDDDPANNDEPMNSDISEEEPDDDDPVDNDEQMHSDVSDEEPEEQDSEVENDPTNSAVSENSSPLDSYDDPIDTVVVREDFLHFDQTTTLPSLHSVPEDSPLWYRVQKTRTKPHTCLLSLI